MCRNRNMRCNNDCGSNGDGSFRRTDADADAHTNTNTDVPAYRNQLRRRHGYQRPGWDQLRWQLLGELQYRDDCYINANACRRGHFHRLGRCMFRNGHMRGDDERRENSLGHIRLPLDRN